jgi:hypothetical protein
MEPKIDCWDIENWVDKYLNSNIGNYQLFRVTAFVILFPELYIACHVLTKSKSKIIPERTISIAQDTTITG